MWSDFLLLVPALLAFFILVLRRRKDAEPAPEKLPQNAIVVDGPNVMHWGDGPSSIMVSRVLISLQSKGYTPIVFFDANAGYVLGDRYYNEAKLASLINLPERHICVVNKGVVADEAILAFATDHGLRVVTNDRFRDWRVTYPHAAKKGVLIGGTWREGSIVWRGKL